MVMRLDFGTGVKGLGFDLITRDWG